MIHVPVSFLRLSGGLLAAGGMTLFIVQLVHLDDKPSGLMELNYFVEVAAGAHAALALATPPMIVGLTGLYFRMSASLRWWGWAGYVGMLCFFLIELFRAALPVYQYPALYRGIRTKEQLREVNALVESLRSQDGFPALIELAATPLGTLGFLLTAVSLLRGNALPKLPALLMLAPPASLALPWDGLDPYAHAAALFAYVYYGCLLAFGLPPAPPTAAAAP
ncbi:hypothetical protein FE782_07220 [Paenibacillus antri]|uniref:DUF4386 domain-containing protein n=1 Tax=Paenibacillus antri TaxID=2582848 RepID=A0A5R9GFI2_9BACL|nr:hypothetical protein [Paenibacillus antri]TLS53146.1 hypothetical protein FE782_07220 [Paenibacillus antri]